MSAINTGKEQDKYGGIVGFEIKALGDYTRSLGSRLRIGQPVQVEFHAFETAAGPVSLPQFRPVA